MFKHYMHVYTIHYKTVCARKPRHLHNGPTQTRLGKVGILVLYYTKKQTTCIVVSRRRNIADTYTIERAEGNSRLAGSAVDMLDTQACERTQRRIHRTSVTMWTCACRGALLYSHCHKPHVLLPYTRIHIFGWKRVLEGKASTHIFPHEISLKFSTSIQMSCPPCKCVLCARTVHSVCLSVCLYVCRLPTIRRVRTERENERTLWGVEGDDVLLLDNVSAVLCGVCCVLRVHACIWCNVYVLQRTSVQAQQNEGARGGDAPIFYRQCTSNAFTWIPICALRLHIHNIMSGSVYFFGIE